MSAEPKRQFKGVWIPKEIWENTNLSWMDKCILAEIWSLSGDDGCYASSKYLAEKFGIAEKTMKNRLSDLNSEGFITLVRFDGKRRWIRVVWDKPAVPEIGTPAVPEIGTPAVPEIGTPIHIVIENKEIEHSSRRKNDYDVLFSGAISDMRLVPNEALGKIMADSIRYGLPEDRLQDFVNWIEYNEKDFVIKRRGSIPGLKDMVKNFTKFKK